MAKGFVPNKKGLAQLQRDLTRELAKYPVSVPVVADASVVGAAPMTVNNYHGPVVTMSGDHAQLAYANGNGSIEQTQNVQPIADGYGDLATIVTQVLAALDALGLSETDAQDVRDTAQEVLDEVTQTAPEERRVRRGVNALRGLLSAAALGVTQAVTAESAETAQQLIHQLGTAIGG